MSDSCLICDGKLNLEMYEMTSYFQCDKDPTHRLSFEEYCRLVPESGNREKVKKAMERRAAHLKSQINKKRA
ncbi:MAG: hypothetical protein HYW70_02755 [Candidatus Nealsonbacteria bacterium]|nr:hypothetical protein [Candidatus Nealsonbacteria bacterium]